MPVVVLNFPILSYPQEFSCKRKKMRPNLRSGAAVEITQLLKSLGKGDRTAEARLIELVHPELRAMAARMMRGEAPDHTLQPTALVNEAYLHLVSQKESDWKDRAHFFGVAAQVMRHILVDHARKQTAQKRGGRSVHFQLDDCLMVSKERLEDLLVLEEALEKLEHHDPRAIQVFVMRFFGGLSIDETAEVLQISSRTVKRDWNYGRAWLRTELSGKSARIKTRSHEG